MSFDLHTHSVCSDGTLQPEQIVQEAAALRSTGLEGIALTDHDTADGWSQARETARALGVGLLGGTEVSCEFGRLSVHMLSYLHRPDDAPLLNELNLARESRLTRAERMVASISTEYPITWADVLDQVQPGATVGRPHIADALVAAGVFERRDDAFLDVLSPRSRHYARYYAPDPVRTIGLILDAGGVPVLAHGLAPKRGRVLDEGQIRLMIEAGLAGIEVYHREHGPGEVETLLELARRHDLFITGSSDYHGAGKLNRLGENRTDRDVVEHIAQLGASEVVWPAG